MIAGIDHKGVRDRLNGYPLSFTLDLQTVDVILKKESEEAVVGVGRHSERQVGLRACRVAVDHHHMSPIIESSNNFFIKS